MTTHILLVYNDPHYFHTIVRNGVTIQSARRIDHDLAMSILQENERAEQKRSGGPGDPCWSVSFFVEDEVEEVMA